MKTSNPLAQRTLQPRPKGPRSNRRHNAARALFAAFLSAFFLFLAGFVFVLILGSYAERFVLPYGLGAAICGIVLLGLAYFYGLKHLQAVAKWAYHLLEVRRFEDGPLTLCIVGGFSLFLSDFFLYAFWKQAQAQGDNVYATLSGLTSLLALSVGFLLVGLSLVPPDGKLRDGRVSLVAWLSGLMWALLMGAAIIESGSFLSTAGGIVAALILAIAASNSGVLGRSGGPDGG